MRVTVGRLTPVARDLELRRFGIGAQRGLERGPAFGRQPLVALCLAAARQLDALPLGETPDLGEADAFLARDQ